MQRIKSTLTELIRLMVNHPEDVRIIETPSDNCTILSVQGHPGDIGQLIGKQGRNARALRTIAAAMAKANHQNIYLEIQDYPANRDKYNRLESTTRKDVDALYPGALSSSLPVSLGGNLP